MISAMGFSAVFLTSYLVFHYNVGNVRFSGEGWVRSLYFSILIPHVILAGVIVPLAIIAIIPVILVTFLCFMLLPDLTTRMWTRFDHPRPVTNPAEMGANPVAPPPMQTP